MGIKNRRFWLWKSESAGCPLETKRKRKKCAALLAEEECWNTKEFIDARTVKAVRILQDDIKGCRAN